MECEFKNMNVIESNFLLLNVPVTKQLPNLSDFKDIVTHFIKDKIYFGIVKVDLGYELWREHLSKDDPKMKIDDPDKLKNREFVYINYDGREIYPRMHFSRKEISELVVSMGK